jgi:hypothetical protein
VRFTLLSHGIPVGAADLDTYDEQVQAARGRFEATPAWERVLADLPAVPWPAPRAEVLAALADRRAALGLALVDAKGHAVATAALGVEIGSRTGDRPELVAYLARPAEWLARYGAPYAAEPREQDGDAAV